MMGTQISTSFILTGRFTPDDVTSAVGIRPTDTWRFGESIQKTKLKRKHDGWRLSIASEESLHLEVQVKSILSKLQPYTTQFRDVCQKLKLNTEISCAIYVKEDQAPSIHLDHDVLKRVAELNAEIDIDIIFI